MYGVTGGPHPRCWSINRRHRGRLLLVFALMMMTHPANAGSSRGQYHGSVSTQLIRVVVEPGDTLVVTGDRRRVKQSARTRSTTSRHNKQKLSKRRSVTHPRSHERRSHRRARASSTSHQADRRYRRSGNRHYFAHHPGTSRVDGHPRAHRPQGTRTRQFRPRTVVCVARGGRLVNCDRYARHRTHNHTPSVSSSKRRGSVTIRID